MKIFSKAMLVASALLVLLASSGVYAAIAGRVQFVHGKVQLTTAAGVTHAVRKGDTVSEGDTLLSWPSASAQIRMEDGGMVAMRADTRLKIERFSFDGQQDGTEKSFFSLFKGGFRAVTGQIGKKNKANYRITTPATTIGIRGTDHETFVVTPGSELAASNAVGTYNKVNLGETLMTTAKGTLFVLPNQMGFVGDADQMPQLKPVNLSIFAAATQPVLPDGRGHHDDGRSESGAAGRETATMDKDGMRDNAAVDKMRLHGSEMSEKSRLEGGTRVSPYSDDGAKGVVPSTAESLGH